jgi:hypothetical protein
MAPRVNTEELVDAATVARILGLSHRNTVSSYLKRYPDMPRPVIDLGPRQARLWLRPEIEAWARRTGRRAGSSPQSRPTKGK